MRDGRDALIERLLREANVRENDLDALRAQLAEAERALGDAERELHDLRAIRDALTPPALPERPGLTLAASYKPAGEERVSGDFYLVAEGPEDATVIVIGDVVGHGLSAARDAAFVRTAFVTTARFSHDPSQLLAWANVAVCERGEITPFITAACATYLPAERRLQWAYAGHPPALWLGDGTSLETPRRGLPLGVTGDFDCVGASRELPADEGLFLYTDGLTEVRRHGEELGLESISAALRELGGATPVETVSSIRERVDRFAESSELSDDLCMVVAAAA